jgi:hypothetical protein
MLASANTCSGKSRDEADTRPQHAVCHSREWRPRKMQCFCRRTRRCGGPRFPREKRCGVPCFYNAHVSSGGRSIPSYYDGSDGQPRIDVRFTLYRCPVLTGFAGALLARADRFRDCDDCRNHGPQLFPRIHARHRRHLRLLRGLHVHLYAPSGCLPARCQRAGSSIGWPVGRQPAELRHRQVLCD